MDRVIANSQVSAGLAAQLRISRKRMLVVHPGADPGEASAWAGRDTAMRAELSIGEGPLLLSVGRLTERKGLREFVTDALPSIVASFPRCTLIVVGDAPSHSLYAKSQSRESIQAAADNAGVGQRLRFLGVISDQRKLARIYRAADLHVFPVRELPGDPEGFGMVAIEAASFGVPTVAYASGGIVESVRDGESGTLVTPGDAAAFASAVVDTLERLDASVRRRTMEYAADFAWPRFDERFRRAVLDGWLNG
jgi:phosphatidylinositol alpha-1,6-mannosyltransferase